MSFPCLFHVNQKNNWMFHTPEILEHRSIKLAITSHTKTCNAKVVTHLINLFTTGIELHINIVQLKTWPNITLGHETLSKSTL
jgi:hypothetical protein